MNAFLARFQQQLSAGKLSKQHTYLLACSGGVDSMVLADLLFKTELKFAIAHCNFQLRGSDSDSDAELVANWCETHSVTLHSTRFDTEKIKQESKENTQIVARKLRYDWFLELKNTFQYDVLLTAHHQNDTLETFFINLARGSGVKGLSGIPSQNEWIYRPLLNEPKEAILRYAKEQKIQWREDLSNASNAYMRNKIRHDLVPVLAAISPNFELGIQKSMGLLQESAMHLQRYYSFLAKQCLLGKNTYSAILLDALPEKKAVLWHLFEQFGFTVSQITQLSTHLNSKEEKIFLARHCRLLLSRGKLELEENTDKPISVLFENEHSLLQQTYFKQAVIVNANEAITRLNNAKKANKMEQFAFLNSDLLNYPLVLRLWEQGDRFQPFGMKGKKLVSDLLSDLKLSTSEKEKQLVLVSGSEIVWLVGRRISNNYRIDEAVNRILVLELE